MGIRERLWRLTGIETKKKAEKVILVKILPNGNRERHDVNTWGNFFFNPAENGQKTLLIADSQRGIDLLRLQGFGCMFDDVAENMIQLLGGKAARKKLVESNPLAVGNLEIKFFREKAGRDAAINILDKENGANEQLGYNSDCDWFTLFASAKNANFVSLTTGETEDFYAKRRGIKGHTKINQHKVEIFLQKILDSFKVQQASDASQKPQV